jgi:magnesium-transporting ATPase (P-type)
LAEPAPGSSAPTNSLRARIEVHDRQERNKTMLSKIVKWIAIAALIGGIFTRSATGVAILLQFAVVAAAVVVLTQAAALHRYVWMGLFIVIACLFNPVFPIPFSNKIFWGASAVAAFLFLGSLTSLKTKPQLSIASVTDLLSESESL